MISIVIPTRNRAYELERCLTALQHEPADEVVVVDDGSIDDTPSVLRRFSWVRSVQRDHGGRSAAKNSGVEAAGGDLILFIDDDVIATPGLVERHVRHHERFPDPSEALLGHVTWSPSVNVTRHMRWLEAGGPLFAYDQIEDPADVSWRYLYTANLSLKKAFLEPFDEELPIYEDTELGYRLSRRGLRLRYDTDALGHHLREETPERTEQRMREVGAAAAMVHEKWPELREPPPPMRPAGRIKAGAAGLLSRAGIRAFDDRLDDWRAARAYALGYERVASSSR